MENTKLKTYIVKCHEHEPGYEIESGYTVGEVLEKTKKWKACKLDMSTFHEYFPETDAEALLDIAWEKEFYSKKRTK